MVRRLTSTSGKWLLNVLMLVFSGLLYAASEDNANNDINDDIIARIAPPGEICLIGDSCAGAATVASANGGDGPEDPEQIYNTYCVACHGTGANNSPVLGEVADWEPRLEKGMETLYENAINGFNNNTMPAKGLCMSCSDEAVRATVDYILDSVQ